MDDTATVIGRVLERLLDGVVVPFLGAGVSMGATSRTADAKEPGTYVPRVSAMVERLARSLLEDIKATGQGAEALRALLFPSSPTLAEIIASTTDDEALIAYLTELSGYKLERWTEAHVAKRGWAKTVEVLRIDRLADLEPQPAHAYLAYLAREALVGEVVTSNYDTCLELALERTLMPAERRDDEALVRVMSSLTHYRQHGATGHAGAVRRPVLHVYKINGCAETYRKRRHQAAEQAAKRIVLTERQLQSFRSEQWAEDLVRDRSRCRALLFCGFGSDDPQVRHTLLAVAREFSVDGDEHRDYATCWNLPNAPFMVTFDPDPSFTQYQVMRGYADAHHAPPTDALGAWVSNVVGGRDRNWFASDGERCLPADLFWRRTFQAAFLRLVDRAAGPGGELRRWLGAQGVSEPATVADRLRTWLGIPTSDPVAVGKEPDEHGRQRTWFGRRPMLLDESDHARCLLGTSAKNVSGKDVVRPLVLSLWLLSVQGLIDSWLAGRDASGGQHAAGPGHPYFPLHENPLLVVLTLLVVSLLVGDSCDDKALAGGPADGASHAGERVQVTSGLGLRITSTDGGVVYLVADDYKGNPDRLEERTDDPAQAVLQIVIPKRDHLDPEERLRLTSKEKDTVRAARLMRVPVSDWLVNGGINGGIPTHAELVRQWAANPPRPRRATVENLP